MAEASRLAMPTSKVFLCAPVNALALVNGSGPWVQPDAIRKANFSIVVDAINSSGAFAVPALLKKLGVNNITVLNAEVNGDFAHNPEPLPEHLTQLCEEVKKSVASLGISVDPDVDRLCFVCDDGSMFGEEYTLVAEIGRAHV